MGYLGTALQTNHAMKEGDFLTSPDGQHTFILQLDGNLVLYRRNATKALWASGTNGKAVSQAIMQADGNLVIYGYPGALWASNTAGKPNGTLYVQNDGNVVIYEPSVAVWTTSTAGQ